ncbi:hypothetical protein [Streptomyces sp. NPDC057939]|uniref:hypothetical protein n=1 Tax=Streptomyces sp. NPDC057939 TaxID=3346284 RepID=UPI0036E8C4BD
MTEDSSSRLSVGSGMLRGMSTADITLDEWLTFDRRAAAATARTAARTVGGIVTSVRLHEYAGRTAYNAIIEVDGRPYVFVPGGHARLGFEPEAWTPTDDEVLSHLGSHTALDPFPEYADLESDDRAEARARRTDSTVDDIRRHIAAITSRPRTTRLKAFLAAKHADEAGVSEAPLDHPIITALIQKWKPGHQELIGDFILPETDTGTHGRVRFDPDGKPTAAWFAAHTTHGAITDELARTGRRLPTPDEWEHAYAFGARSLFPWGDRMPTRWLEDDNTLVMPDGVRTAAASPMLSGLHMAQNSYKWELTTDRREVRGADGGGTECGAEPWFAKWLIRASSYRDPEQGDFVAQRPHTRGTLARPVIPLE